VINFRAKTKLRNKVKKAGVKSRPRAMAGTRELTAAEIAEINRFDYVIAKMNARVS
jgi:hypothetical protein